MTDNTTIASAITALRERIHAAEVAHGRAPGSTQLLAVSKGQAAERLRAAAACGQVAFGENYLQEALNKRVALADLSLSWHFIGAIQTNKTKSIAENFDWVHSIDRAKLLQRLNDQRPSHKPRLNVCLQVNIDAEASKAGAAPEAVTELARIAAALPRLRLRGLMAIPAPRQSFGEQRQAFAAVRKLAEQISAQGLPLDTLSMGMSADLEAAVAEGATLVRIGSALFGPRPQRFNKEEFNDG